MLFVVLHAGFVDLRPVGRLLEPGIALHIAVQAGRVVHRVVRPPQLAHLGPVGRLLDPVRVHLARGKGQVERGRERYHAANLALDNVRLVLGVVHDAQLTVSQLEDHAGERLTDAGRARPDERDGLVLEVLRRIRVQLAPAVRGELIRAALAVLVVRDERKLLVLLDLGKDRLAAPDGGSFLVRVQLAVKFGADRRVQRCRHTVLIVLVVQVERAALEIHAVVDDDGIVGRRFAVRSHRLGADGSVVHALCFAAARVRPRSGELALERQQNLVVLVHGAVSLFVVLERLEGGLVLERFDAVSVCTAGRHLVLHHGEDAVAVVLVLFVARHGEVQLRRGLAALRRRNQIRGNRRIRPFELEIPAALGQPDAVGQRHIHHAVLDGDVLMRDGDIDLAVLAVRLEIPVALTRQHGFVADGREQVARTRVVDDLRCHRGEMHLWHIVVAARQEHIRHAFAQFFVLGQLTGGIVVHADRDALICGIRAGLRLKIQGLALARADLERGIREGIRRGRGEVVLCIHIAVIVQRAQIAGGLHRQHKVLHVLCVLAGDVHKIHRHGKVRAALYIALGHKVVFRVVQPQPDGCGQIDSHAVAGRCLVVGEHAVKRVQRSAAAVRHTAEVIVERICAVRSQVFIAGAGEIQRGGRCKVKQGTGEVAPVAERRLVRLDRAAADRIRRNRRAVRVVGRKNLVGHGGEHLLGGDRRRLLAAVHVLVIAVVDAAERGIIQHARLHRNGTAAAVLHAHAQAHHAGFVRAGVRQRDALRERQPVHTPHGLNHAVRFGDSHLAAAGVAAAKEVILGGAALSHAEREERGVVLSVVIQQVFVIIGFFQAVALHGLDREAAVAFGNRNADIIVTQRVSLGQLGGCRLDRGRREQPDHQRRRQQP